MLSFENDYSCTATPEIIERISEIAQNQYPGYGNDSICESAKAKIREACACPDAQIFFLVGGTQTNQTIIDSITPQYAGVIAASTGHVNVHEAGAIEFTGHKVLTLPHHDGKIDATELDEYCAAFYATATTRTWCSPDASTFRRPPNTARSTRSPNLRRSARSARSTTCRCSSTAHDLATR